MTFNRKNREAKVVFAGLAPLTKGTVVHLEYPRIGDRLGENSVAENSWLNPNRMRLPSHGITHIARDSECVEGPFHWTGRSKGLIEAVVRSCEVDAEVGQSYFLVDVVAEHVIAPSGTISSHQAKTGI